MCEIGIRSVSRSLFHSVFILKNPKIIVKPLPTAGAQSPHLTEFRPQLKVLPGPHFSLWFCSFRSLLLPTPHLRCGPRLSLPPLSAMKTGYAPQRHTRPPGTLSLMHLLYPHWAVTCHILSPSGLSSGFPLQKQASIKAASEMNSATKTEAFF